MPEHHPDCFFAIRNKDFRKKYPGFFFYFRKYLLIFLFVLFIPEKISAESDCSEDSDLQVAIYTGTDPARLFITNKNGDIFSVRNLDCRLTAPLGSLWKLFVYIWLTDKGIIPEPYLCKGGNPEESFCCKPGYAIRAEEALYLSCGLFFDPERLGISPQEWKAYWKDHVGLDFEWLTRIERLKPDTSVPVRELLDSLYRMNRLGFALGKTQSVLSNILIQGTAKGAVRYLGNTVKIKTFTWNHPRLKDKYIGGFAGWLNDGASVWLAGKGKSHDILSGWDRRLSNLLNRPKTKTSESCVEVRFFEQYPIEKILKLPEDDTVGYGPLRGIFKIGFKNGKSLTFKTDRGLYFEQMNIVGKLDLNEYVARVIDREIETEPLEAAKAFAIIIRTYLLQNAVQDRGCFRIADSSRFQRVSVQSPTSAAMNLSYWTEALILTGGKPVNYRFDQTESESFSWIRAKKLARDGCYFDEILRIAYPGSEITLMDIRENRDCERLPHIESWLKLKAEQWQRYLISLPGYERPENIEICLLRSGNPYSETEKNRMTVRSADTAEDRISIAHEYLHLVFKHHPSGMDENFIEQTARELILKEGGEYEPFRN